MINREKLWDSGKRIISRGEGWLLRLEHYNFTFEHISGETNIADPPSRLTSNIENCQYKYETNKYELCEVSCQPRVIHENMLAITKDIIKEFICSDLEIQEIIKSLEIWSPEIAKYKRFKNEMYVEEGVLMKNEEMVLPMALRYRALKLALFSHPGMSTTPRGLVASNGQRL